MNPLQSGLGVGQGVLLYAADGSALLVEGASSTSVPGAGPGADQGVIVAPPTIASATWTDVNFGAGTTAIDSGLSTFPTVYLSDFTTGGAEVLRGISQPRPGAVGADYTLTCRFRASLFPLNNSGAGLFLQNAAGLCLSLQLLYVSGGVDVQVGQYASPAIFVSNLYTGAWNIGTNSSVWFKIQNNGTDRLFSYSPDGDNWQPPFLTDSNGTWIPNNETAGGPMITPVGAPGSGVTLESFSWTSP